MAGYTTAQLAPINPILSAAGVIGAMQDLAGLVFPRLTQNTIRVAPRDHQGTIFVAPSASMLGTPQALETALGADYPQRAMGAPTTVTYRCVERKLASEVLPQRLLERSQMPTAVEEFEAGSIARSLALAVEADVLTTLSTTANWTGTSALTALAGGGGVQWSSTATAAPMSDLRAAIEAFRGQAFGLRPDTVVMSRAVAAAVARSAEARGIAVVTQGAAPIARAVASDELLVALFRADLGLDLIIADARRQTSADGLTHTSADLLTDTVWLGSLGRGAVAAGSDVLASPSAMLLIVEDPLSGIGVDTDGLVLPMSIRSTETIPPTARGVIISGEVYTDAVVCMAELGYTITDCLA
jgi:hypothetical protein